jgi:hypothetical protein
LEFTLLRLGKDYQDLIIEAKNGTIGKLHDLFVHDNLWSISYLIIDTTSWVKDRILLVSPYILTQSDWSSKRISVDLFKEQIHDRPDILFENNHSFKEVEINFKNYYRKPILWIGGKKEYSPQLSIFNKSSITINKKSNRFNNQNLTSLNQTKGYNVHATDRDIGHVEDYIIDDQTWAIHSIIVDLQNNFTDNKKILVVPQWINEIVYHESTVFLKLSQRNIKSGYTYDHSSLLKNI